MEDTEAWRDWRDRGCRVEELQVALPNKTIAETQHRHNDRAIHLAAQFAQSWDCIEYLHRLGADLNAKNIDGYTALHTVGEHRDDGHPGAAAVVKALVARGADLEARDNDGWTPLMLAIRFGNDDIVQAMCDLGGERHATTPDGETGLVWAERNWNHATVKLVKEYPVATAAEAADRLEAAAAALDGLRFDFSANELSAAASRATPAEPTPLELLERGEGLRMDPSDAHQHKAVWNEWAALGAPVSLLKLNIASEAVVKEEDYHRDTVLEYVARHAASWDAVEYLVRLGADVTRRNKFGQTALHQCAELNDGEGGPSVICALVARGVDVEARDHEGYTALILAIRWGRDENVKALIDMGADRYAENNAGESGREWATRNWQSDTIAIVDNYPSPSPADVKKELAEIRRKLDSVYFSVQQSANRLGFNMDPTDSHKHIKRWRQWQESGSPLDELMVGVPDIDVASEEDYHQDTALEYAAKFGQDMACIEYLVRLGVDVTRRNKFGQTALHQCAELNDREGSAGIIRALVARGVDVEARDHEGYTALILAIRWGRDENVKALIDMGADRYAENNAGESGLEWATRNWQHDTIALVKDYPIYSPQDVRDNLEATIAQLNEMNFGKPGTASRRKSTFARG